MKTGFKAVSKALLVVGSTIGLVGCGFQRQDSPTTTLKSIVDGRSRVFGLVRNADADVLEFKLCRGTILPPESLKDPQVCINPYLDESGSPLTFKSERFESYEEAVAYLKRKGYTKGATLVVPAAIGAVYVTAIGVMALNVALTTNSAGLLAISAPVAGGVAGFSIWGRTNREDARNLTHVLGDFYQATAVKDSLELVNALAELQGLRVNPSASTF